MTYTIIPLAAPVVLPHVDLPVLAFVACHDRASGLAGLPATLPVTRTACWLCGDQLPAAGAVGGPCRVDGDSRYGYELSHEGCNLELEPDVRAELSIAQLRCPDCGPVNSCVHM